MLRKVAKVIPGKGVNMAGLVNIYRVESASLQMQLYAYIYVRIYVYTYIYMYALRVYIYYVCIYMRNICCRHGKTRCRL